MWHQKGTSWEKNSKIVEAKKNLRWNPKRNSINELMTLRKRRKDD